MYRSTPAIGSSVFFLIAPGVVAGVVPWWLTRWRAGELMASAPGWAAWVGRTIGLFLLVPAAVVLVHAFTRFVIEGAGTRRPSRQPDDWLSAGSTTTSATPCTWPCWPSSSARRSC